MKPIQNRYFESLKKLNHFFTIVAYECKMYSPFTFIISPSVWN